MHGHHESQSGPCRHHRHRHRGFGPRSADFMFGPGGPGGWGGPRWRARKARRGDIRTAALLLLAEEPRNGYQLMQEIENRSEGAWRPSPGSVYPALQQLEDEGLIRSEEIEGRKAYRLTVQGLSQVEQRDPAQPAPWEQMSDAGPQQARELAKTMRELAFAFAQVMHTGSADQQEQARKALAEARRTLYRILGEGDAGEGEDR
jgi:DNA-binding PadR family transcriptional regulator